MYDLIIIGGGPAAAAGGVYAARKKLNTLVLADQFGGQSVVSQDIQNWIGTRSISGYDLSIALEQHLRAQESVEVKTGERVASVAKHDDKFTVMTERGNQFETKTVLVATGGRRRKLGIPGEKELDGKGVVYCSICDAPLFQGKTVAVVGGGNAGLEAVIDLFPYANKIYLLQRSAALKGDAVTQEQVASNPRVSVLLNAATKEIIGDTVVTGLIYEDTDTKEQHTLQVDGVFVEIGSIPNSELVRTLVSLNPYGEVEVDSRGRTSVSGVWAAGDVTTMPYKQNNIAAGDAIRAVLDIYSYLITPQRS
ncbi:MAG: FAD-dependent oxidoreductase [Patescibacteria group bacterium]|nr:FAD-dependent oxidoreductase [Patescibacteria group bacterium]MDE2438542.1 FAD-dependent oxidoreductase [Patescibacteria group bacterium]